jgi:hypothetical protein
MGGNAIMSTSLPAGDRYALHGPTEPAGILGRLFARSPGKSRRRKIFAFSSQGKRAGHAFGEQQFSFHFQGKISLHLQERTYRHNMTASLLIILHV